MEQVKKMYRISRSIRKELGFFVKKFEQYSLSFSLCISNKMVQFVECKKLYILLVLTERSFCLAFWMKRCIFCILIFINSHEPCYEDKDFSPKITSRVIVWIDGGVVYLSWDSKQITQRKKIATIG